MSFTAHLEYLFHITCSECKYYWTYAAMQKNFNIENVEIISTMIEIFEREGGCKSTAPQSSILDRVSMIEERGSRTHHRAKNALSTGALYLVFIHKDKLQEFA